MKTKTATHTRPRFSRNGRRNEGSPHDIDAGLRFEVTLVSPELASQMLENLHPRQRNQKPGKISGMVADMEADRWHLTHQGVAFDEDGYLVDGRNKLVAVQKAGKTVPMVICYGLPREALPSIDTGTSRTANDAGKIAGIEGVGASHYAVARQMVLTPFQTRKTLSTQEVLDALVTYRGGLDFAFEQLGKPKTGVTTAQVRAVVARAYYTVKAPVLVKFCACLYSGLPDNSKTDAAVILLRNWLLEPLVGRKSAYRNRPGRREVYLFAECALDAYVRAERLVRLEAPAAEVFPVPNVKLV